MRETGVLRAVVFDLDGTRVDSAPDIAWSINRMLAGHRLSAIPVGDVEKLTGEGAPVQVAAGEMCQNRIMFKQFIMRDAIDVVQIDA